MRCFLLEKILILESYAVLSAAIAIAGIKWSYALPFCAVCFPDLERKLNMWAIFQKRTLTEDPFACCVRVLLFIDKALSRREMYKFSHVTFVAQCHSDSLGQ